MAELINGIIKEMQVAMINILVFNAFVDIFQITQL